MTNMSQFQIEAKIQEAIDAIWSALNLSPEGRVDNLLSGAQELLVRALHGDDERDEDYVNNDPLDGDFDTGMASAGWGTDEDYGGDCERF
jgi:hypothetical protein